jgi:hypothetical protein
MAALEKVSELPKRSARQVASGVCWLLLLAWAPAYRNTEHMSVLGVPCGGRMSV